MQSTFFFSFFSLRYVYMIVGGYLFYSETLKVLLYAIKFSIHVYFYGGYFGILNPNVSSYFHLHSNYCCHPNYLTTEFLIPIFSLIIEFFCTFFFFFLSQIILKIDKIISKIYYLIEAYTMLLSQEN